MQALVVAGTHPEVGDAFVAIECFLHATRGVFAEHQVLCVESGEGLFVFAFDRGLHRRLERVLDAVDHVEEGKVLERRL